MENQVRCSGSKLIQINSHYGSALPYPPTSSMGQKEVQDEETCTRVIYYSKTHILKCLGLSLLFSKASEKNRQVFMDDFLC